MGSVGISEEEKIINWFFLLQLTHHVSPAPAAVFGAVRVDQQGVASSTRDQNYTTSLNKTDDQNYTTSLNITEDQNYTTSLKLD